MQQQHRKARLPRVERGDGYHMEEEDGHSWAVSYADFLMVLLSFFILFFSVDNQTKESVVEKILIATQGEGTGAGSGDGTGDRAPGSATERGKGYPDMPVDALQATLANFQITAKKDREQLILMFPDNIYRKGQIALGGAEKKQFKALAEKLTPFMEKIEIIFVGHTDSSPLVKMRGKVLQDNFDLSVIRASKALQYAVRLGLPPEHMSAKGSAEMRRDSRTLTLIIKPLEK